MIATYTVLNSQALSAWLWILTRSPPGNDWHSAFAASKESPEVKCLKQ